MSARESTDLDIQQRSSLQDVGTRLPPNSQIGASAPEQPPTQRLTDGTTEAVNPLPPTPAGHQRFVLTDPVAFRYLEEDPTTKVLGRRRELSGYECYIVEQWTTSRMHPTFVITTYTGDPSHVVVVSVLSVPTDESTWSPRLRVYFKALNQNYARRQETPLGILMVTNLSGFQSSLTVVPVPDGDMKKHRFDFFVNENLKRLGCSGRMGLTLAPPAGPTIAKFHQLYRTSDKNNIYRSVIELVKLCQSALMLFDKLEVDYSDGLLCDVTERAINDWWLDIGGHFYQIEPHDGILGPTTVSALLGLLMGARNRLHSAGAPVGKDPFEVDTMKRGISSFQKQQKMERTRRLDRATLDRLHKATQKSADKERWVVPKAVKSTMAELSGKGGDIDATTRRDRASIAEIETVDIDRFASLAFGPRCKWLWLGKPMKKGKKADDDDGAPPEAQDAPILNQGLVFKVDDEGGYSWTGGRKSTIDGKMPQKREQKQESDHFDATTAPTEDPDDDAQSSKQKSGPIKRANDLRSEARANLEKMRGAVSFRGHKPKPSVDDPTPLSPVEENVTGSKRPLFLRSHSSPTSNQSSPEIRARGNLNVLGESSRLHAILDEGHQDQSETRSLQEGPNIRHNSTESSGSADHVQNGSLRPGQFLQVDRAQEVGISIAPSTSASDGDGSQDHELKQPKAKEKGGDLLLRRTVSFGRYVKVRSKPRSDDHFPRHLSFSLAEENVLMWSPIAQDVEESQNDPRLTDRTVQLAMQMYLEQQSKELRSTIGHLEIETTAWTTEQLTSLKTLIDQSIEDHEKVENLYYPRLEEVQNWQTHTSGIVRQEKERFVEGGKELEALGAKLEYEVNALKGKLEDVEAGVSDFKKGVIRVEERVAELEKDAERRKTWECVLQ